MIQLKVSVCSLRAIKCINRPEPVDQLARVLRRAVRAREGKGIKIYAPRNANKVTARLWARIKSQRLNLKCGYKKHTIWVWKEKVNHKDPLPKGTPIPVTVGA